MQYVQVTKLVNGYQPVQVSINPAAVVYVEPRFAFSNHEEVERGAHIHFAGDFCISVQETVYEVLRRIYDREGLLRAA